MKFEIDFESDEVDGDNFLIYHLGGKLENTGSLKYPPFERIMIEIRDFKHLEDILKLVDKEFNTISTALISFDNPTIYIEL